MSSTLGAVLSLFTLHLYLCKVCLLGLLEVIFVLDISNLILHLPHLLILSDSFLSISDYISVNLCVVSLLVSRE